MAHGTVKFFNAAKGFGFITSDDDGKDVFVPAASVTASGITGLKTGQRLSFDSEPDKKGLKAVGLKLLDEPVRVVEKKTPPAQPERQRLTLYLDPSDEDGEDALDMLRDAGHEPRVVDYIATPPPANDLKRLSLLLRDGNQSLVRKYEPMFLELRLDDRFISDNEFWGAIHEHPSLINGPILASNNMACVCRTEQSLDAFLEALTSGQAQAAKPKGLSDRLLMLVRGEAVPPRPPKPIAEEPVAVKVEEAVKAETPSAAAPKKATAKEKPATKAAKPAKPAPKAKAPAKKAAAKPVKKIKK